MTSPSYWTSCWWYFTLQVIYLKRLLSLDQLLVTLTSVLLYITGDIYVVEIFPLFGPVAGGTNMSLTLRCPQSGCGDLTLYIGDNQCLLLHQTRYVW